MKELTLETLIAVFEEIFRARPVLGNGGVPLSLSRSPICSCSFVIAR
jgi:hypothetical protein